MSNIDFNEVVKAHNADRPITPSDECNYGDMYKRESALIELVREMKEVLRFYANKENYVGRWDWFNSVGQVMTNPIVLKDKGQNAQALLDRLEKDNPNP